MDEETAKRLRGRAKAALTRITNFASSTNEFAKRDVENRIKRLEKIFEDFEEADSNLPERQTEIEQFEREYFNTKATLQNIFDNFENTILPVEGNSSFKLPHVNIQPFDGKFAEWPSFKDLYIQIVHENKSLSSIQKFQYLKGLLVDEPANIIKHIPVSANSYVEAWQKLLSRYDSKKQIMSSIIKTFLEQPAIIKPNVNELRRLTDVSDETVRALRSLHEDATKRDPWLIHLILQKVDSKTKQAWAESNSLDFPAFETFIEFLENRCSALELYEEDEKPTVNNKKEKMIFSKRSPNFDTYKCVYCKLSNHLIFKCYKFKQLNVKERKSFVSKNKLCFQCLSIKHDLSQCNSHSCFSCNGNHHSLLCESNKNKNENKINAFACHNKNKKMSVGADCFESFPENQCSGENEPSISIHTATLNLSILPTAELIVCSSEKENIRIKALLDSGSETCLINNSLVNKLKLKRRNARLLVKGISDASVSSCGEVDIRIYSPHNQNIYLDLTALILNKLTGSLPRKEINKMEIEEFRNLTLADPAFFQPKQIDLIIGATQFFDIILPGKMTSSKGNLIAQNQELQKPPIQFQFSSTFGFLISGNLKDCNDQSTNSFRTSVLDVNIDNQLQRFWELEEVLGNKCVRTPEEEFCEEHFMNTHKIGLDGRFVVSLPFVKNDTKFGDTKSAALSRLRAMERKFVRHPEFEKQYKDFMLEYESLGHMTVLNDWQLEQVQNFLPHHAVLKPDSDTTKCRVVFDSSARSSNGISLNSVLAVGEKLQNDLFDILLNFRFPEIVVTADIEKMYRQIWVAPEDRNYQCIIWRYKPTDPICGYQLNTVSYGTSPASFLATRCLEQIANIHASDPELSDAIKHNFYMDDLLTGSNTIPKTVQLCKKLSNALQTHGFHLRKWKSNSAEMLNELHIHFNENPNLDIKSDDSSKVLGLVWNSTSDTFCFKANLQLSTPITKRKVLSESARIFDPLGLLSPCTVVIKIFYQKLWLTKGDWDTPIPQHLVDDWLKFQNEFDAINACRIPRHTVLNSDDIIQLHGFADASSLAFAAAIYCRQVHNGSTKVNLLVSKTKVAPLKQISIPRLELSGAHLLAKLFKLVLRTLSKYQFECFAWTDSRVVLAWISDHPRKWKTFVANRTSQIIEVIPTKQWNYVPSKENPADIASRGTEPKLLPQCKLWWHGPEWLSLEEENWPMAPKNDEVVKEAHCEQRKDPLFSHIAASSSEMLENLFERFSNMHKIIRIVAYCQRFLTRCKERKMPLTTSLSTSEIKRAKSFIISSIQNNHFSEEISCLKKGTMLQKKSTLRALNPFLDENGMLRVGGRLQNSSLPYRAKHPIILPSRCKFSELLVQDFHLMHLHAGPSTLSHILRQTFWIVGGNRLVRKGVNKCINCIRHKPTDNSQLMGNLPSSRVTFERTFYNCGIDYAGPFVIKFNQGRGAKTTKAYIALFICLGTKAVHLEVVSDLTTECFIAALRRFISRRGVPRHIFSDNGSNFVGASHKLNELQKLLKSVSDDDSSAHQLSQLSIDWHFNPPLSPHTGGLWEAAVKSTKLHLRRICSSTLMTFEELTTLLCQIEAILNSRPLYRVNENDPDSINVITPSHFLAGDVIATLPEEPNVETKSIRSRWEMLQNLRCGFWRSWRNDYLSSLQRRTRWQRQQPGLRPGDLVLLKDNACPASWPLGLVKEVHPAADGLTRIVTLKSGSRLTKRHVKYLVPIPLCQD